MLPALLVGDAVWSGQVEYRGHSHRRPVHTHYLRVYMGQLRKKIEDDPAQPRHLVTETGIGYRFVP